jgi:hypothetical protein
MKKQKFFPFLVLGVLMVLSMACGITTPALQPTYTPYPTYTALPTLKPPTDDAPAQPLTIMDCFTPEANIYLDESEALSIRLSDLDQKLGLDYLSNKTDGKTDELKKDLEAFSTLIGDTEAVEPPALFVSFHKFLLAEEKAYAAIVTAILDKKPEDLDNAFAQQQLYDGLRVKEWNRIVDFCVPSSVPTPST